MLLRPRTGALRGLHDSCLLLFHRLSPNCPLPYPELAPLMDILDQIKTGNLSYVSVAILVILGLLTVYVAYRIGRLLLKVFCILIGLAVIAAAVSWFVLRH